MAGSPPIKIGPLKQSELPEADRIFRLAFGTFIGMANPAEFAGDRQFLVSRWHAPHAHILAARQDGRLIGSNAITRWGSFAYFGPLTVLPEYWDRGVAQLLLAATVKIFDKEGLKRTGLFTFPHSTKHVGLYQKFGYWPGYLTAIMAHTPNAESTSNAEHAIHLSTLPKAERDEAIASCARLTDKIDRGLDLSDEIRWMMKNDIGEVVLTRTRTRLDGFALCAHGRGSDGGTKLCYIKFAAARGPGAGERFDALLDACDALARSRGVPIEAGVNLAREDAFRRMRAHGYRAFALGLSMQRPHAAGHNRADVYAIDDWR